MRTSSINRKSQTTIGVSLGERSYPIYIGTGILSSLGSYCSSHQLPSSLVIITDSTVAGLYRSAAEKSLRRSGFSVRSIVIPAGEAQKNLRRAESIYAQLLTWRIERNAAVLALGGGVIGDLAGFIAATYQRGIRFVQVPTTLLAQVDSSVGGKVGINHALGKNMIGAFYQPDFVLADTAVLRTLPKREMLCGIGEVVKYGIIKKRKFFDFIEHSLADVLGFDNLVLQRIIIECCRMKAAVVVRDEREAGLRAILNFGHTIGHALERAGKYHTLKHGEAILYGMAAESWIASRLKLLSETDFRHIEKFIRSISLPSISSLLTNDSILMAAMRLDKKVKEGTIHLVLPTGIGSVTYPVPVGEKHLRDALRYLKRT